MVFFSLLVNTDNSMELSFLVVRVCAWSFLLLFRLYLFGMWLGLLGLLCEMFVALMPSLVGYRLVSSLGMRDLWAFAYEHIEILLLLFFLVTSLAVLHWLFLLGICLVLGPCGNIFLYCTFYCIFGSSSALPSCYLKRIIVQYFSWDIALGINWKVFD